MKKVKLVLNLSALMILMILCMLIKGVNVQGSDSFVFNYDSLARYNPSMDQSLISSRDEFGIYYRNFSYEFLDGSITSFPLYLNFYTETVYTPNGTDVSLPSGNNPAEYYVCKFLNDLPTNVKIDIISRNLNNYNIIQANDSPTTSYNCHSFAWYSQNLSTNDTWISFPTAYYIDESYEAVTNPRIGDIVCYYDNCGTTIETDDINLHSGIIVGLSGENSNGNCGDVNMYNVKSKWGMEGLYTHKGDECPYVINHGGSADYVKYYRPRVNYSYTISQYSQNITRMSYPNGLSSEITDKYEMYELNVNYHKNYQVFVSSTYPLDVRLYDEHMQALINNPTNNYNSGYYHVSINPNLSVGRYYLRVAYQDITNSGTIGTQIISHEHNYTYSYTWLNYNQHKANCACGMSHAEQHVVSAKSLVDDLEYVTCILCGGPANAGIIPGMKGIQITESGSFISPNGTLVLVDEDIERYLAGEIEFECVDVVTLKKLIPPYFLRKDEEYL